MNVKDAILSRRSVRSFAKQKVPPDILLEVVDAARLAPTGSNKQGGRYRIVDLPETIALLQKEGIFPQPFVCQAPALIFCCFDESAYPKTDDPVFGTDPFTKSVRDLAIASAFLVLRAEELGLGTCYVGWMDKKKCKRILRFPDAVEILFTIAVGYPAGRNPKTKRKELKDILV